MSTELKPVLDSISSSMQSFKERLDNLQSQTDSIDKKMISRADGVSYGDTSNSGAGLRDFKSKLIELKSQLESHGRVGFEIPTLLESKSQILSTSITSTEPTSGVAGAGRNPWRLRGLFRSVPAQQPTIGTLRTNVETLNVSPQVEGVGKAESAISFTLVNHPVQTLASFVNVSRQALDDVDGLAQFLDSTLIWALERKAELEILGGDGTGVHLTGLTTAADAFDTSILSAAAGYTSLDFLGAAATQLIEAGYSPDFAVVSPRSWFRMVSRRSTTGEYVLSLPTSQLGDRAYQLQILPSAAMVGDGFLVGDSSQAVIRQKMETTVAVSYEHNLNWTTNMATILAEQRLALQILRPDSFVYGSLASSPA